MPETRMSAREWGLLFLLGILWGGSFFFAKIAVAAVPPLSIVLVRVSGGAMVLYLLALATGAGRPATERQETGAKKTAQPWAPFFVMGFFNNVVPFSLIFWSQIYIPSALAAILGATTPIFAVLVGYLVFGEKPGVNRLLGLAAGLAGVALALAHAVDFSSHGGDGVRGMQLLAELAVLGATLSYAWAGFYGRRFRALPSMMTARRQLAASSFMILPIALAVDHSWQIPVPSATILGALLGLVFLSTALGYVIYFKLLASAGPSNTLLVTILAPAKAVILGSLILGERPGLEAFLGFALIAFGLLAIDGRLLRRLFVHLERRNEG